ncbi:MAG: hypothetical protein ACK5IC_09100 [Moheibacter sp.]
MKTLRNIGIYYTTIGVLCGISWWFFQFYRIVFVGLAILLLYLVLRYLFQIKELPFNLTQKQPSLLNLCLYALPFLFMLGVFLYLNPSYKQKIVVPKDYEGLVVIFYDQPNGQEKKWMDGFLGIGQSWLIEVDSTGVAKTKHKYPKREIPFLHASDNPDYFENVKVYFKNDLKESLPKREKLNENIESQQHLKLKQNQIPTAFYIPASQNVDETFFVVTNINDFDKYFNTDEDFPLLRQAKSLKLDYQNKLDSLRNNTYYDTN